MDVKRIICNLFSSFLSNDEGKITVRRKWHWNILLTPIQSFFRSGDRGSHRTLICGNRHVRAWWEQMPAQPIAFTEQWVKL